MNARDSIDWTGALITRLTELWELELPISEIAGILREETGYHLTRNTVAGKVHRLALPPRPSPIKRSKNPIAKRVKDKSPPPPWMPAPSPVAALPEAPKPMAATTLAETDSTRCKWLMGQVVKPESRHYKLIKAGGRTWNAALSQPMKSDSEPVYTCWADVPRCPNERHPGRLWCEMHSARGYYNFVPSQAEAHTLPETPNTVE
jgi:hypothetical protein